MGKSNMVSSWNGQFHGWGVTYTQARTRTNKYPLSEHKYPTFYFIIRTELQKQNMNVCVRYIINT
jgi:hypothetical protein